MTSFTCRECGRSAPAVEPSEEYREPVCQSCHEFPTPGPSRPTRRWDEYEQLERAVRDFLDHEPDDPTWSDIWRALGAIMGGHQRDAFLNAFDLNERAETACIRRLITGEDRCDCDHGPDLTDAGESLFRPGGRQDQEEPPHKPPASDHATLWLDNGEPAVYSMHVYPGNIERLDSQEPPHNLWFDLFNFAAEWGLEVSILPKSWYNLGSTVQVIFYPPERYRSAD